MLSADHVWVVSSGGCVQSSGSLPFRVMNNDVLAAIVKNPVRLSPSLASPANDDLQTLTVLLL